jgi:hypothetical protein
VERERRSAEDDLKEAWNSLRSAEQANLRALEAMSEELREARRAVSKDDSEALRRHSRYASKIRVVDTQPIHDRIRVLTDRLNHRPILERMLEHEAKKREQK